MGFAVKGITKLSELEIDANKDWATKGIDSLGYVIIEDGAGHYLRLPSLTTAQRDALTAATGMLIWNSTNSRVEKYDGSDWGALGVTTFLGLSDTPASYTDQAGKYPKVNAGEDALEFGSAIAGVKVRKNSQMPILGTRPQLNFIEGAAIGLELQDNPPDDEIDITVHAKYPTRFKRLFPYMAALPTANPAAKATVDGTNFAYDVLDFDPGTEESAFWEDFLTPDYLSENIVADIFWESAGAGDAKFGFSVLGREKGETWDSALGTEQTVVATNAGAGKLNKSRVTTFAPGWAPGDVLLFKLARKAGDAADTIDANDVRVLKVVVSYTGRFAQSFYPLVTPFDLGLTTVGAWHDVDVSAYVPAGATGVILHIVNNYALSARVIGLRKKGSTDNRTNSMYLSSHQWAMVGIDEGRVFQAFITTNQEDVYLVGYTTSGVVFFDNAYDKSLGVANSWEDIDLSAECPGAIGVIVELVAVNPNLLFGLRKNGSTDNRYCPLPDRHAWAVIGCDGGQIIKHKVEVVTANGVKTFIVGYITEGAVFKTNGVVKDVGVDTWADVDCSAEAPKAIMLFCEMATNGNHALIRNGADEDTAIYLEGRHTFPLVACDSSIVCRGKQQYGGDFFLIGYATWG